MNYLDIIIFAAVAVFLAVRLWSVLGRRNEDENERPNPFVSRQPPPRDEEDVMVLPKRAPAPASAEGPLYITDAGHAMTSLAGVIDRIRTIDPAFDEKQFLQGARAAFTLIVEAFARGDLSLVARLLSQPVRDGFQQAIEARKAARQTLESRIERISGAEVAAARLEGSRAFLTVDFDTLQENILRTADGNAISGIPGRPEQVSDIWVFTRDLNDQDPNWILAETRS